MSAISPSKHNDLLNHNNLKIGVLIPCFNEEISIAKVISDFSKLLPSAIIYVYDNDSQDQTAIIAKNSGAVVRKITHKGKGNVVRQMFADIDADIYVLVDGDDTYQANSSLIMIEELVNEHLDMVVAIRQAVQQEAFRRGHRFGNHLMTNFVSYLFNYNCSDVLSGYRVFSRRFVKSFPVLSTGFEIEIELTIHAFELRMPVGEVSTLYKSRLQGSTSKLNTYRDGLRIFNTIHNLFRQERPLTYYGILSLILAITSLLLAIPIINTYLYTGLVPRFPTAFLSMGIMLLAVISLVCGLILDTVTRGRNEIKRLFYLSIKSF